MVLAAVGIIVSILGTFFVKVKDGGSPHTALNIGEFGSAAGYGCCFLFHHWSIYA